MDPQAGNSVVTYLNQSLRNDAKGQIEVMIEEQLRIRSRLRRRRELAGEKETAKKPDKFNHTGELEYKNNSERGPIDDG